MIAHNQDERRTGIDLFLDHVRPACAIVDTVVDPHRDVMPFHLLGKFMGIVTILMAVTNEHMTRCFARLAVFRDLEGVLPVPQASIDLQLQISRSNGFVM